MTLTSETISDSAECYAGLPERFESPAGTRPKNKLITTVFQDGFKVAP